jgi:hypothetical protein
MPCKLLREIQHPVSAEDIHSSVGVSIKDANMFLLLPSVNIGDF